MKHKCLIVDDEELARELIATHIAALDQFEVVASCDSAIKARTVLNNSKIDLVFLDIEMPLLKGTDFVRSMSNLPPIIFTTAYRDFAISAFDLDAVDYLLKPITFDRFFKATEKYLRLQAGHTHQSDVAHGLNSSDYIFVRHNRKQVKVELSQILYIESQKDYITIHLPDTSYMVKYAISAFANLLDHRFIRIHRSYIVNGHKVTAYTKHDVEIDTRELSIGEQYKYSAIKELEGL